MNNTFQINAIGQVTLIEDKSAIELDSNYLSGLIQVEGFSHLQIIWWAHLTDGPRSRETLIAEKLFKKAPDKIGIFGTRAPARPNPIMISTIKVGKIDIENGIIHTPFIDAEPGGYSGDIDPPFRAY